MTEPATPSAKDTNSPVGNDPKKDANELEMMSEEVYDYESEPSFDITKVGQLDTSEWFDDSPDQSKKALEKSITIGSKVWKDIPDAGKYIREKRDQKVATLAKPATPSAKDTNSPVCNDSEKDVNKLSMTEPSKTSAEILEKVRKLKGIALQRDFYEEDEQLELFWEFAYAFPEIAASYESLQAKLEVCQNFKVKTFPELENDSFDAGYARAVKDMKEAPLPTL